MSLSKKPIESMTLVEKLAGIRSMVEVIRKNKSGYNYKYVSEDEILARVTAGMDKYHVLLYPGIVPQTAEITPYSYTKTKNTKDGKRLEETVNEVLVKADMVYTWVNLDNPEDRLEVPWLTVGQQADASQAVGSGLSYLNRYFLLKMFQIATPDDDPDNWRSKKQETAEREENELIAAIIAEVQELVSGYLERFADSEAATKEARDKLTALVKKYVKDAKGKPTGDYRKVNNMKTATELLNAVRQFVEGEAE